MDLPTLVLYVSCSFFQLVNTISGSKEKLEACRHLGADVCINYKTEDFVVRINKETGGKGIPF